MAIADFLDKTCSVQREQSMPDPTGAESIVWIDRFADVACGLQPANYRESQQFAREDSVVVYKLYTTTDISPRKGDRVNVGGDYYLVLAYRPWTFAPIGNLYCTFVSKRN